MDKNSASALLGQTDIFRSLPGEVLQNLAQQANFLYPEKETTVLRKGEPGNSMFVIASGSVRIHDGEHIVATLHKGNFFGEFSLLDEAPRSMSVTAEADSVLVEISRESFFSVLQNHPGLTKNIIAQLTKKMRSQNDVIISQLQTKEEELSRLVKQRTAEVVQQKEIVEMKNKEILDSIHYAKRLQDAILPGKNILHSSFPENFILYLPKDIVAGDFYWTATASGNLLVAVADCTGHGVAGALMSMLGVSLLNQIVNEKKNPGPSAILNLLHLEVVKSLKQSETDSNEGMDIAILSFNFSSGNIQFAGANRPLWLIRNNEIIVITPDKVPVGGLQIEHARPFTSHSLQLQKGDSLYLFTDGYADQFGGEMGKKLMTKTFKDLLLSIQNKNMNDQEIFLRSYFEKWKGSNEQVDDVLVLGIRV